MKIKRVCFKCSKKLKAEFGDINIDSPPADGVYFASHGNYGSTVFDSLQDDYIEIYICDECLVKHAKIIYHITPHHTTSKVVTNFKAKRSEWSIKRNKKWRDKISKRCGNYKEKTTERGLS